MPTPKLIEFCDVTILRGEKRALDRVTFSIGAGEHVAILGPNGSGKSTLIQAITRECYPSLSEPPGRVRIWGKDVWHLFELRGLLGIVTKRPRLRLHQTFSGARNGSQRILREHRNLALP